MEDNKEFSKISHVLFDMDGLLLDTERLYSVAQQQILDRFNIKFTWEVKRKMMGRKALDAVNIMIDIYKLQDHITAEEFLKERETFWKIVLPKSLLYEMVFNVTKKHALFPCQR